MTLVEIDLAVIDIARKYFAEIHRGALNDPRLKLKVEDGLGVRSHARRKRST